MAIPVLSPLALNITTTPSTPASGTVLVYAKSNKHGYQLDSDGVETDLAGSGGSETFSFFVGF